MVGFELFKTGKKDIVNCDGGRSLDLWLNVQSTDFLWIGTYLALVSGNFCCEAAGINFLLLDMLGRGVKGNHRMT